MTVDLRVLLEGVWEAFRRPMTSGQRQSAVLLVPLTIALVLYGRPDDAPTDAGFVAPPAASTAPTPSISDLTDPVASPPTTSGYASSDASSPPGRSAPALPVSPGPAPTPPPATAPETTPPGIVAVVRPGDSPSSDEAMAAAFLDHRGIDAVTVTLDPDADVCGAVLARGSLVVASTGLGPSLRACLVHGGAVVIAYDSLGDHPPSSGAGEVLSTRRGVVDSLTELAVWAIGAGRLQGATGLVTVEAARQQVELALPLLQAAGVDVTEVVYLPDGDPGVAISRGVLDLVAAGVESTVFVAPVAAQRGWVQQSSLVSPEMEYLVADAFDAFVDADHGAGFDGAVAQTTLRFPWSAEPVPTRDECDRTWAQAGGGDLTATDTVRMYAWCQHAEFVSRTGAAGASAGGLRDTTLDSPLTTPLGPLGAGGWGPTQATVVRWRSSCTCWVEDAPPSDRTTRRS